MVKGKIIGPMDKTGELHHKSQYDLNLHINATSIRLSNHGHSAVGAIVFTRIGRRHPQYFLPIAYGPRGYIDVYIYNTHILDLNSVEPTIVKEYTGNALAPPSVQGKSPNGRQRWLWRLGR